MAILRRVLRLACSWRLALAVFGRGWLVGRLGIGSVVAPLEAHVVRRCGRVTARGPAEAGPYDSPEQETGREPDEAWCSAARVQGAACQESAREPAAIECGHAL